MATPFRTASFVLLGCFSFGLMTTPVLAQEPVPLESLEPLDAEFGTLEAHFRNPSQAGAGKFHAGAYHIADAGKFWTDNVKIVEEIDAEAAAKVTESTEKLPYHSLNPDLFLVGGEPTTGVGLWVKIYAMYHWVDFPIPAGATRITGLVMTTDDSCGYMRYSHKDWGAHNFTWSVSIDGEEVYKSESYDKIPVAYGDGKVVGELNVEIPQDAEVITFQLTSGPHIDWSKNTEIVINEALFEFD